MGALLGDGKVDGAGQAFMSPQDVLLVHDGRVAGNAVMIKKEVKKVLKDGVGKSTVPLLVRAPLSLPQPGVHGRWLTFENQEEPAERGAFPKFVPGTLGDRCASARTRGKD